MEELIEALEGAFIGEDDTENLEIQTLDGIQRQVED